MSKEQQGKLDEAEKSSIDERYSDDRRRVLKKLGTYGLYTAPVMLAVLDSAQAIVPVVSPPPNGPSNND